jgi:hypothetical protein
VAHALIGQCGARFYIANAEIEYKFTQSSGLDLVAFDRSARFVRRFRQLRPKMALGLSSYGRFDRADIHYAVWLNEGKARALPQSYPNEQGEGFPKPFIHLTIPKPDPNDLHVYSADEYVAMLHDARMAGHPLGFSAYEIEAWSTEDVVRLGAGITEHQLAFVPP